jgi:glycosyltransferase involved in cell wall biosynthesis
MGIVARAPAHALDRSAKAVVTPVPVTVVILTLNEGRNLAACLDSLAGFDDIHVLDSGSTDDTAAIATARGVPVHVNPFTGFGDQRNFAIDRIAAKHAWQFHLDADERMTPALAAELRSHAESDTAVGGFHVPSKLLFAGRWLKRAGQYPGYQVRFFHRERLRFVNHGHGQREVTTHPVGYLREPITHLAFSHGLDAWFAKHIRYARREAERTIGGGTADGSLFSRDGVSRRRALKRWVARVPFRYPLRLTYMLLVKRAILDGWPGITFAHMLATYEGMMDVYLRLLRRGIDVDRGL